MSTIAATRSKTYDIVYIAVFAVIMAICSWISIPTAVPFTLQTFGVFVAVGVLGGKRGTLSILVFILLGAIGVPVFAGFSGGIGVLAGTTGGYIIGFLFSKTVLVLVKFAFVVVILEFIFTKLLLSSESLLLLVDKVTYIKAHSKNTRPMPSVNKYVYLLMRFNI